MPNTCKIRLPGIFVALFSLLCLAGASQAQNRINMPYSIYGLGEIRFNHLHQNMGMGGLSQAYRSNMTVNYVNPASYSAVDSTSFVFDATMVTHFYRQETSEISQYSDYVSLANISFSFPITRRWAFGAGIKPYSLMGYSIRDIDEHELAGTVNYLYEGSGGLTQLFLGSAFKPFGDLSVGVNASYVFGDINREYSVLSDSAGVYLTNRLLSNKAGGWMFGFGMQYEFIFSSNRELTIGATYGGANEIDVSSSEILRRRLPGLIGFDTIANNDLGDDRLTLPRYYGAGVFARLNQNWAAGLEYQWQNWENFEMSQRNETFNNNYKIAGGVEFKPTVETYSPFFYRLQYTAGFRYEQSYLTHNNEPVNEFGISFGMFIPVRRAFSGIKLGFEYSQRGSVDQNLMQEDFYRLNIGINIYERWFIRRRFF